MKPIIYWIDGTELFISQKRRKRREQKIRVSITRFSATDDWFYCSACNDRRKDVDNKLGKTRIVNDDSTFFYKKKIRKEKP